MPKNIKFKIIASSCFAVFIALIFYFFCWQNLNKKVELNFSENVKSEDLENEKENNTQEEKIKDISADAAEKKEDIDKDAASVPVLMEETKDVKNTEIKIIDRLADWGFQGSTARKIDTIIIHSSYDAIGADPYSVNGVIAEYKSYSVAPHYLIDRKGNIYRLVEDKNIAYHAGESRMPDGRSSVNDFSIGIEMLTTKKDKLTSEQYSALNLLIKNLKKNYKITNVLGHNQIAPGRKDDPWNFEWGKIKK